MGPRAPGRHRAAAVHRLPDRRTPRRRRLPGRALVAARSLDAALRRHRGRPQTGPAPAHAGQDAVGRGPLLRGRPAGGAPGLGHPHRTRRRHLPRQRLRGLHRPRLGYPQLLRVRGQRLRHRVGPAAGAALPRRRPPGPRLGPARPAHRGPGLRHDQRPRRRGRGLVGGDRLSLGGAQAPEPHRRAPRGRRHLAGQLLAGPVAGGGRRGRPGVREAPGRAQRTTGCGRPRA